MSPVVKIPPSLTLPLKGGGNTLIIASHNPGKVREIGELLAPLGLRVISAAEAGIDEPEETGDSFAANAALKAEHASWRTGSPALADDSGLVIPALGGAPGIYSARWAKSSNSNIADKNFAAAFERIEKELGNKPPQAYFVCVLALSLPGGDILELGDTPPDPLASRRPLGGNTQALKRLGYTRLFEGRVDGRLIFPPRGANGFGYDPVFIPQGYDKTFGELEPAFKHGISHRARAFTKLVDFLKGEA